MKRIIQSIREWWLGTYVPRNNDPTSNLFFVQDRYERHWTARFLSASLVWLRQEYKWFIGAGIALASLIIAAMKL